MRQLPLFIVTGASGMGNSAATPIIRGLLPEFDVFDVDILEHEDGQAATNNWLRIAYSIAQSGRGTVLCGAITPEKLEECDCADKFSRIHLLNLHSSEAGREERLQAMNRDVAMIEEQPGFAPWLLSHGDTFEEPPVHTIDTGLEPPSKVAERIAQWVRSRWSEDIPAGEQDLVVEPADMADREAVCRIDQSVIGNDSRRDYFAQAIHNGTCIVARSGREVAGFAVYENSFFGNCFIALVIVAPRFRRRGAARSMIQYIERRSPTPKLFTSTNESNTAMQQVCESLGFVRSGMIDNLDEGDPEIIYYKRAY
ncbi:GNAT family N-acetyltransferase [Paenibacillus thiaminolyticus]|uniref:GNAT family N-acetyltransferase n=1 Tax=Paenibacillus thiaminolyticus TaxID=49283 RepID=UPI003B9875FA